MYSRNKWGVHGVLAKNHPKGASTQACLHTCFANKPGRSSSNLDGSLLYIVRGLWISKDSRPLLLARNVEAIGPLSLAAFFWLNTGDRTLLPEMGVLQLFGGCNVFRGGGALNWRRDLPGVEWEPCCSFSSELVERCFKRSASSLTTVSSSLVQFRY